jgi:DNA-binding transcriptional LysR family regulator
MGRMDKLRALQTFIAIVDHGSLTAAAEALGSSLPAVVRSLAALEGQLGARLLNRTTRRLALTDDGRQYLERARRIVAELDEADRLLGSSTRGEVTAGTLNVTAPVLYGQQQVAPAVRRFLQQHPQVKVRLLLLDRVVNLVEEGLDVGIRIGHLQDSSVVARALGSVRRVVAASPALLRRAGTPKHPRELLTAPCLFSSQANGHHWAFVDKGRRLTLKVQGPLESNLVAPLLDAAAEGLGFVRCLSYQAAPYLADKRLRIVLAGFEETPWPIHITYPGARLLPLRTRVFVDWLKAELVDQS